MKKNFFLGFIALAALIVSSCSNDADLTLKTPDNAIEFGTYVGRDAQTRAHSVENLAKLAEDGGFGVYAYYTDGVDFNPASSTPNFMKNQNVTSADNGLTWTYDPVKYWPNEVTDKLSFFAYAPWVSAPTVAASGDPVLTFTVPEDVTDHTDLLVADASALKNLTKQTTTGNVQFNFKHALSRVGFKVEAVVDEVNNQGNGDVDTDGQYYIEIDGITTVSVQEVELIGDFYTSAGINMNTSEWGSYSGTTSSYSLSSDKNDFESVASGVTHEKQRLNKDTEYMMIIPHATMGVKVRVKYTVTTKDDNLDGGKSVVVNDITSVEFPFTFDQGKAYNFVLHLGLTSVKLSASVSEWDDETDHVVNVPLNLKD